MSTRKKHLEDLIEINEELEIYFRNTIIPQLFVDANLLLRKFTPPAMKQFSLSPGDIGKYIGDIEDNFRYPHIIENIEMVIAGHNILEKEIQTTDRKWYQMNIIPYVVQKNSRTNGVIITFVDITSRIRDLKEQEKLISDHETLLDTLSHDVKTPLTSLVLSIELLKSASLEYPEEFQDLLKAAEASVNKMKRIIFELTDTRKDEHKYKAEEELLNIEHIVEDVRLTLNDKISESGAIIKCEFNVSQMTFSRKKLRSILFNLVTNGIKFRSPDRIPEIFIRTWNEDPFVVISVNDNGIGIDESNHEIIFSKYARIDSQVEGSGIGLYLIKEIVTSAGGKIQVNSQVGKGSEFKVYLRS